MDFLELSRARGSVRRYSPKPVCRQAIERCLEAARLAPSACNSQPWSFVVVDDPQVKADMAQAAFSGVHKMNAFASKAPVLIAVVTERSSYAATLGGYFKGVQFALIDIGIACEHLILQAADEGLGTCWLGWFDEKAVKRVLGISRKKRVDILISMGYPDGESTSEKKRRSLDEIRKYNV